MTYLQRIEPLTELLENYDHFDVKTIDGDISLREFLAGMFSYHPTWMQALYAIRAGFVRLLGMKQEKIALPAISPETISFTSGDWMTFFQVTSAEENQYWVGEATDKHLTAYIAVVQEILSDGQKHFHVGTIVHYHHWTGPVYFNVIRPFHHLVVNSMMKAGIRYQTQQGDLHYA